MRDPYRTLECVNSNDIEQARTYNENYEGGLLWVVNDERLIPKFKKMFEDNKIFGGENRMHSVCAGVEMRYGFSSDYQSIPAGCSAYDYDHPGLPFRPEDISAIDVIENYLSDSELAQARRLETV